MKTYWKFVFWLNLFSAVINISFFFLTNSFFNMAIGVMNLFCASRSWRRE